MLLLPPIQQLTNFKSNSMSEDFSLKDVYLVQALLDRFDVASVVTGDVGLLYHGVDIAVHVR
jgi:ethanolamine utilization microcompartment shell protein EutS